MKKLSLTDRDLRIFRFLWRHKLSTTAYLWNLFFDGTKEFAAYKRLYRLRKAGYLRLEICDQNRRKLWTLTTKSFNRIKKDFPDLVSENFISEAPYHDMVSNIVQLGVFDTFNPQNIRIVTEQELRCLPKSEIPQGIPTSGRRSDGYWVISSENGKRRISIEVELSPKKSHEYRDIAHFYDHEDDINFTLWVMEKESLAKRVFTKLSEASIENLNKHVFILLSDFLKNGSDSRVIAGTNLNKTLSDIFLFCGGSKVSTSCPLVATQALSDMRIKCWN